MTYGTHGTPGLRSEADAITALLQVPVDGVRGFMRTRAAMTVLQQSPLSISMTKRADLARMSSALDLQDLSRVVLVLVARSSLDMPGTLWHRNSAF